MIAQNKTIVTTEAVEFHNGARLLPDLPTAADAFGPHRQLANAIADLIRTEEGGKAIALEGGWGSGKSSVIEMLRAVLSDEATSAAKVQVHVFDAWSHEGDPLRRVFLEDLTAACLDNLGADSRDQWEKRRKTEISGKTRETDQKTVPILQSAWPLLTLAALTLFPIGVALVGGLARHDLRDNYIFWSLVISAGIALLVPIALSSLFVYCVWPFWPFSLCHCLRARTEKSKKRELAGRLISLYAKKIDETTRTTAHETSGPTSIEFQRYFSDLLDTHLKEPSRKLVLVLDNLDRVPTSTARTLWTTLRVFAECCENKANSRWAKRVWFVVPYDPDAARRLWDDGEDTTTLSESNLKISAAETEIANASKPIAPRLSAAFLDKTFQIRFDVPPLLLADWKQYLDDLLRQSLGQSVCLPESAHRIYLLSRRMAEEKKRPPTPRHLKLYVNDIGALYRRFDTAFPIEHLALYAILRRQGHDIRLWLLENQAEHDVFSSLLGSGEFVASLCAMAHGTTDIDKARDLHLRSPIESSLASGNATELTRLSKVPGFWQVLEIICDEPTSSFGTDEGRVVNTLTCVEASGLLSTARIETSSVKQFLERLIAAAEWKSLSKATGEGAASAIRLSLSQGAYKSLLERLASVSKSDDTANLDTKNWIAGIRSIVASLNEQGLLNSYAEAVHLPAEAQTLELLDSISTLPDEEQSRVASVLSLSGESNEFVETMLPQASVEWSESHSRALRVSLLVLGSKCEAKDIGKALIARLSYDAELTFQELERLTLALENLESSFENVIAPLVEGFVKNGTVFRRLNNCLKHPNTKCVSRLFSWAIQSHNFSTAPSTPTGAPEGFAFATQIARSPENHPELVEGIVSWCKTGDKNSLLYAVLCESSTLQPLAVAVCKALKSNGRLGSVLDATEFTNSFANVTEVCAADDEIELGALTKYLLAEEAFARSLGDVSLKADSLEGAIHLIRHGAMSRNGEFAQAVQRFLADVTSEEWTQSLRTADARYEMVCSVRAQDGSFALSGDFPDSLEKMLADIIDGSSASMTPRHDWQVICNAVPGNQQVTIAAKIIERADSPDKHLVSVIPLFRDRLRTAAIAYTEESFVRNALITVVQRGGLEEMSWLVDVSGSNPAFWSQTPESDQKTFAQAMITRFQSCDEDIKTCLRKVGEHLGMSLESDRGNESQ